jgi:hypothetical protein
METLPKIVLMFSPFVGLALYGVMLRRVERSIIGQSKLHVRPVPRAVIGIIDNDDPTFARHRSASRPSAGTYL